MAQVTRAQCIERLKESGELDLDIYSVLSENINSVRPNLGTNHFSFDFTTNENTLSMEDKTVSLCRSDYQTDYKEHQSNQYGDSEIGNGSCDYTGSGRK